MRAFLKPGGALIATRLHAMIYAITQGIPVATLAYQDKHLDFLRSIGWQNGERWNQIAPSETTEYLQNQWSFGAQNWPKISQEIENLNQIRRVFYRSLIA